MSSCAAACVQCTSRGWTTLQCRIQAGKPLSALDGVPYAVKDDTDALPYSTTGGTTYVRPQAVAARAVLRKLQRLHQQSSCWQELGMFRSRVSSKPDVLWQTPTKVVVLYVQMASIRMVTRDAELVASMRETGAVLIGKTALVEHGLSAMGLNTRSGTPRNPYNPSHLTGGSSSGSAAAVAAGLCPFAFGAPQGSY